MNELIHTIRRKQARTTRTRRRIAHSQWPRLMVYRSNRAIYVQVVDSAGRVMAAASNLKLPVGNTVESAKQVGLQIAAIAIAKGVTQVVFDRGAYRYHGRVRALAEGAREGGLIF